MPETRGSSAPLFAAQRAVALAAFATLVVGAVGVGASALDTLTRPRLSAAQVDFTVGLVADGGSLAGAGATLSARSLDGRNGVLAVFPTTCGSCWQQARSLADIASAADARFLVVLADATYSAARAAAEREAHGLTVAYGSPGLLRGDARRPELIVTDPDGHIAHRLLLARVTSGDLAAELGVIVESASRSRLRARWRAG